MALVLQTVSFRPLENLEIMNPGLSPRTKCELDFYGDLLQGKPVIEHIRSLIIAASSYPLQLSESPFPHRQFLKHANKSWPWLLEKRKEDVKKNLSYPM